MDSHAANYDPHATVNLATWCVPSLAGCMMPSDRQYSAVATVHDLSQCAIGRPGCMESTALNYDADATVRTTCFHRVLGCLDPAALNYGCGLEQAYSITACRPPKGGATSRVNMLSPAGVDTARLVTSHLEAACRYAANESSMSVGASQPAGAQSVPHLDIEFVGEGDAISVTEATKDAIGARFAQLTRARNPSVASVSVRAASILFTVGLSLVGTSELDEVLMSLARHTVDLAAFNAFLDGTGAPTMLMLPRLNVTWLEASAGGASDQALTGEAVTGISLGAVALGVAITVGVFVIWRRKRLGLSLDVRWMVPARVLPHRRTPDPVVKVDTASAERGT